MRWPVRDCQLATVHAPPADEVPPHRLRLLGHHQTGLGALHWPTTTRARVIEVYGPRRLCHAVSVAYQPGEVDGSSTARHRPPTSGVTATGGTARRPAPARLRTAGRHRRPTAVPVRRGHLRTQIARHRVDWPFESWGRFLPEHTTAGQHARPATAPRRNRMLSDEKTPTRSLTGTTRPSRPMPSVSGAGADSHRVGDTSRLDSHRRNAWGRVVSAFEQRSAGWGG